MPIASRVTQVATLSTLAMVLALVAACARSNEAGEMPRPGATAVAPESCAGDWELVVQVTRPLRMRLEESSVHGRITLGDLPSTGTFRFPIRDRKPASYAAIAGTEVIGQYTLTNSGTWRKSPPLNRDVTMSRSCVLPPA
jgi:hypothetical protein